MNEAKTKIEEVGSLQDLTHALLTIYLAEKNITTGNIKVSCTDLYYSFLSFLERSGYRVKPSSRAFGRACMKKLAFTRGKGGTHYLINQVA